MDEQVDFNSFLESFSGLVPDNEAKIIKLPGTQEQITELIDQSIFGLLSQGALNTAQVSLLSALLQARY